MFHTKTKSIITKGILGVLALSSLSFATTLADDYLYVNAAHLNVRVAGTYRSAIVATVDSGYKVTVLESHDNGWEKVLLENGESGYVNGRYLTEQEPYFEKAQGSSYEVTVPSAYVRAEGMKKVVAVVHSGDRLEVLDEKVFLGKWLRVRVLSSTHDRYNDRVGYISKKLVTVIETSMFPPVMESTMDASQDENMSSTQEDDASTTNDDASLIEELGLNSAPAADITNTGATATASGSTSGSDDLGGLLGDLLK